MIQIKPILIGLPKREITQISIIIKEFKTSDTTTSIYYEAFDCNNCQLTNGDVPISEEEFNNWGSDNSYIEDVTLRYLGLTRESI